jgi:hypothetical protein
MHKIFKAEAVKLCFGLALVAMWVVTPAIGQTTKVKDGQMSAQTVTINGKVKMASETALTVVDDQKAEVIVSLDAKTKITKGGKAATAADIKADDTVTVVATKGEGDTLTAKTITVA